MPVRKHTITVNLKNQETQRFSATRGQNLLRVLADAGLPLPSPCGGKGLCGKCKVKIVSGTQTGASPSFTKEFSLNEQQIKAGYRLACQVTVTQDLTVDLSSLQPQPEAAQIMVAGEHEVPLHPLIRKEVLSLPKPSPDLPVSDVERVEAVLGLPGSVSPALFPQLSSLLRKTDRTLSIVLSGDEVLSIEENTEEDGRSGIYGMAVDLGTTTIVGYLIDLVTGKQIDTFAMLNPQKNYGADVISRVNYTIENEDGLATLTTLARNGINEMIRYFCRKNPGIARRIFDLTLVGNTIMIHFFAGLDVKNMAVSPYIPVVTRSFQLSASQIGIEMHPNGKIRILPMIAGFVGADTVAAILACGMGEKKELSLLIDIGTNGEIAIGNSERILTCSTAAGPAFEGANLSHGMGGVEGAINRIWVEQDLEYSTIGNKPPKGICGSAVIDLVAEMLRVGLLEPSGRIKTPAELKNEEIPLSLKKRLHEVGGKPAILIADKSHGVPEDIYFTQKDVREVQLAKAAIAAGTRILLQEMGVTVDQITHLYLAGGFGNYIDYDSAIKIGLLPKALRKKVVPIGNGAGVGAKMALLSQEYSALAERIQKQTKYLELSTRADFQNLFLDALEFNFQ